jgi:AcrR family transcriptional regulator
MSGSNEDRSGGSRGYHHGNLKEALLGAALELIAQKGPAGFTFAEAARWAGVSPAAPYRHFRDRDELLASVALRGFERFAMVLEQGWDDGRPQPLAALDRLGKAYLQFARAEPACYSAMFEAGIPLTASPELREAAERAFAVLRGASETLCAQMPLKSRPPSLYGRFAYLGKVTRHCLAVRPWRRGTAGVANLARRAAGGGSAGLPAWPWTTYSDGSRCYLAVLFRRDIRLKQSQGGPP